LTENHPIAINGVPLRPQPHCVATSAGHYASVMSLAASAPSPGDASPRRGWHKIQAAFTHESGPFFTVLLILLSAAQVWPILASTHLPFQDLPQHLAAIAVLRDALDNGSVPYFDVDVLRTQYLAYYVAALLLSYPFGIVLANKLLLAAAIVALPWSLAHLLRVLGRDPRLCVFAFGLTYNAHVVLGFENFIAAIPLVFLGLAQAVELRHHTTWQKQLRFALVLLLCFYTHVLPFMFLGLGALLVWRFQGLWALLKSGLVFVPVGCATLLWLLRAPAGRGMVAAVRGESPKRATFASFEVALRDLPLWLTDVLQGDADKELLQAWGVSFGIALCLGLAFMRTRATPDSVVPASGRLGLRLSLLSPLAALLYFVAPTGYDWIWPISARFPLLSLLFAILLLPRQRGMLGAAVIVGVSLLAFVNFGLVSRAFAAFEREEVGEIDAALSVIPPEQRVAGLMFNTGSRHVKFSPFIHYVALYQAQKGGAVMFTFADFPQSPFAFKPETRPPRVPPRWEWMPGRVDPERDLTWYSYVLVRGGPGRIQRSSAYDNVFRGPRWSVWRRR